MEHLFSFSGRARRLELWITNIVISLMSYGLEMLYMTTDLSPVIVVIVSVLIFWVALAVGTRRCHDLGHNALWQFIPFYVIWMLFVEGQSGTNEYGPNPK